MQQNMTTKEILTNLFFVVAVGFTGGLTFILFVELVKTL